MTPEEFFKAHPSLQGKEFHAFDGEFHDCAAPGCDADSHEEHSSGCSLKIEDVAATQTDNAAGSAMIKEVFRNPPSANPDDFKSGWMAASMEINRRLFGVKDVPRVVLVDDLKRAIEEEIERHVQIQNKEYVSETLRARHMQIEYVLRGLLARLGLAGAGERKEEKEGE